MNDKCSILDSYINKKITRKQASLMLDVSLKTVSRIKQKYLKEGINAFIHGNKGKIPTNKTNIETENKIVNQYKKYKGFNFTHFLDENPNIKLTDKTITRILNDNNILSPNSHKKKKQQIHPLRKRKKCFGELIQMDASKHDWLDNGKYLHLHLAIDDATSKIVAGEFGLEETTSFYIKCLSQILTSYGIPKCFYTDNRTTFNIKRSGKNMNYNIQFKRICNSFGIDIKTTSIPQAKGRIERANRTFQDRLLSELKFNNIKDIDSANKYLKDVFIHKFNKKFSIPVRNDKNLFSALPNNIDLNIALATHTSRKVLNGNVISINNKFYKIVDTLKNEIKFMSSEIVTVLLTMNKELKVNFNHKMYDLLLFQNNNNNHKSHPTIINHPWKNPVNYGKRISEQVW